jgi:hypothetical protein
MLLKKCIGRTLDLSARTGDLSENSQTILRPRTATDGREAVLKNPFRVRVMNHC